ncbi:MAG: serine/threonine-protein kinase [Gemmatimonadaceae bacterium]|nr:serine/threonine-protein kinase [Gemmatimonadaceae bacterium]
MIDRLTAALADRYRLDRELGAGGMATVYLAHDVRHDRDVAIKVLHPDLGAALGGERFLTEIRTTARLQHPHVLPLLDSGSADGLLYYVMPLVTGETLRARLDRERQLPIADAVRIAREVASALDYAHRQNVIHRDIKPENILLHDGSALVADFGIALAVQSAGGQRMTQTGLSLGTPNYMSPEQAMGERTIDARSDLYALGAVTYEMLVGEAPFTGPSVQAIIARVLTEEPRAIGVQRKAVPAGVEYAVLRALEKLPADRFESAREFIDALGSEAPVARGRGAGASAGPEATGRGLRALTLVSVMVALVSMTVAWWGWRARGVAPNAPVVSFSVPLSDGVQLQALAISADGRQFAYIADSATIPRLRVRSLDSNGTRAIGAADGLRYGGVAFSPDGKWVAFVNRGRLMKAPLSGGPAQPIADLDGANGIVWTRDNTIVLGGIGARGKGLRIVSANGGDIRPLTTAAAGPSGHLHMWPVALPDGRHIAFTDFGPGGGEDDLLSVTSLESGEVVNSTIVGQALGYGAGRLLYKAIGEEALLSVPFDPSSPRAPNDAEVVSVGSWNAALSETGVLVAASGGRTSRALWVSADGRTVSAIPGLDSVTRGADPRLSPNEAQLAFTNEGGDGRTVGVSVYTLANATISRLGTMGQRPEWTPDGSRVLYQSTRTDVKAASGLLWQPADGSGTYEVLGNRTMRADGSVYSAVMSPDAAWLLFRANSDGGLKVVRLGTDEPSRVFVDAGQSATMARFSPDGRWVAYVTGETARREVYVRPFPGPGPVITISAGGGTEPIWSRDGTQLFYRAGRQMISARVEHTPTFRVVSRTTLFEGDYLASPNYAQYDVARDGRFLMLKPTGAPTQINVLVNWPQTLRTK